MKLFLSSFTLWQRISITLYNVLCPSTTLEKQLQGSCFRKPYLHLTMMPENVIQMETNCTTLVDSSESSQSWCSSYSIDGNPHSNWLDKGSVGANSVYLATKKIQCQESFKNGLITSHVYLEFGNSCEVFGAVGHARKDWCAGELSAS